MESGSNDARNQIQALIDSGDKYAQSRAFVVISQDLAKAKEGLKAIEGMKLGGDKSRLIAQKGYIEGLQKTLNALPKVIKEMQTKNTETEKEAKAILSVEDALKKATLAQEKLMRLDVGLVGLNNGTITGPGNALANVTPEDIAGLQAFIDQDLAGIQNLDAASAEFFAKRQTDLQNLSSASMFFGASLTNAFRQSMDEGADFGDVLGKMLEDVIKQLLAAAAAAFALSVIMASFGMGGFGLAKGASFSQLFTAGFGNMSGLGLSSSNLSGASGSSNKNMNINVTGRIKGNDIVLSNERSEINRIRERGF